MKKLFFFSQFYIFLSVTADTIKLGLIFKIRSKATKVAKRSIHSRNKFHFSEVHGSMNTTDHVQSKWCPKGVTLSLHGIRCFHTFVNLRKMKFISYIYTLFLHRFCCFHTSVNLRKMKFISYIYTLFLHRFCSLFVEFWFKSCKYSGKERRPINYCMYLWRCLRVTSRERVSFMGVWTSSKIGSSKEIVGECKYNKIKQLIHKLTISHHKYWWQFIMSAIKQANDSEIISQRECIQKNSLEKLLGNWTMTYNPLIDYLSNWKSLC